MLTQQDIIDFCNQHDYDIRESHNGRWTKSAHQMLFGLYLTLY